MNRRAFIKTTSAGFSAVALTPFTWGVNTPKSEWKHYKFRSYQPKSSPSEVLCVTPQDGAYLHTFFDVCPFSPSGRYLAVTKFPFEDRDVSYGDIAEVCVIDLQEQAIKSVYSTKGWAIQIGANLNWGATDRHLYTNDWINGKAVSIQIDVETGEAVSIDGPMYHIHPKEQNVVGFPLDTINQTQVGYGVPYNPKVNNMPIQGAPGNEGLWQTDTQTGKSKLITSLRDIRDAMDPRVLELLAGGNWFLFHSKYNRQGTRIMQVVRCLIPDGGEMQDPNYSRSQSLKRNAILMNLDANGRDIQTTITHEQWQAFGHHPNWHPDGKQIVMNLTPKQFGDDILRFIIVNHDGSDFRLLSDKLAGSGHPSVTPDTRHLITDCYTFETQFVGDDGMIPLRLINLTNEDEIHLCRVYSPPSDKAGLLRVDPHPVWSRDYRKVCFNGVPERKYRQVFVANVAELMT